MRIGYVRVSTVEQNEDRQYEALERYDIEKYFQDKSSGKDTNRVQFQEMMNYAREGDTIYVEDFSRLARSTEDLLRIVRELEEKHIGLVSMKESIDTGTSTGKLLLTVLAAIAEFERTNMLERQREGIEIAKRKGVYKGRKKKDIPADFGTYYDRWDRHEISKAQVARELGVSRPTCIKFFTEYEKTLKNA